MKSQASMYASESLNGFISYLDKKYDFDTVVDDAEIENEILFEHFLKNKNRIGINKLLLNTLHNGEEVRSDLAEKLELKKNEPQFRKDVAGMLREMREEVKNGYRYLSNEEQERILNCRLELIVEIFGNDDIFFSRRRLEYKIGNKKKYVREPLPLRKEVTILIIRCYKPYGLFYEREQEDESIYLDETANEEESQVLEKSANQLELCPSL